MEYRLLKYNETHFNYNVFIWYNFIYENTYLLIKNYFLLKLVFIFKSISVSHIFIYSLQRFQKRL